MPRSGVKRVASAMPDPGKGWEIIEDEAPPEMEEGFEPVEQEPSIMARMGGRWAGTDVEGPTGEGDTYPWTRMGAVITGAMVGGSLGTKGGAAVGTAIAPGVGTGVGALIGGAGGTLGGAAFGAAAPEITMEVAEQLGLLEPGFREKNALSNEDLKTVIEGEVILEMATGGGLAVARLTGRGATRLWTGIGKEKQAFAELGAKAGINMMPVAVGGRSMPRAFVAVAGHFPYIASPIKQGGKASDEALATAIEALPARIAIPAAMNDLSADIFSHMKGLAVNVDNQFKARYEAVYQLADQMKVKVKPDGTLLKADEVLADIARQTPASGTGRRAAVPAKSMVDIRRFIQNSIVPMRGTDGKPVAQSLRALDGVMTAIDEQIGEFAKASLDTKYLVQLRQAVSKDMLDLGRGLIGPAGLPARDVGKRIRAIDTDFSNTMNALFESVTANRLGSVTRRGMGGVKYQQATLVSIDHLADILMRGDAPSTVDDLSRMLQHAPDMMKKISASVLDRRVAGSLDHVAGGGTEFNVSKFEKALGLTDKKSFRYQQTSKLLAVGGGLTMPEVEQFAKFAQAIASVEIPNVSRFVARRATMGGIRSASNVLIPGLAVAGGTALGTSDNSWARTIAGGLLFIGGSRMISKAIANPDSARALRHVLKSESGRIGQKMASFQVFRGAIWGLMEVGQITMDEANDMMDNSRIYIDEMQKYQDNAE